MVQIHNPSVAALYEDALVGLPLRELASPSHRSMLIIGLVQVYETGSAITSSGALTAYSGAKTGRSPLDKRIVREESSQDDVWYVNHPPQTAIQAFRKL